MTHSSRKTSQEVTRDLETEKAVSLEFIEYADHDRTKSPSDISEEHRNFLIQRHGTDNLKPLPSADPKDPLNWSDAKKSFHIFMIASQTFAATFMSAGISPGYSSMAEKYGKSVTDCSYLTTAQIGTMGILPLVWNPLMDIFGRKPILVLASLGCMACNIGGAYCKTYGQQMATRIISAVFLSAGATLGGAFTGAMCFDFERARKNGIWSFANIVGTPGGPFLMGFVVQHVGIKWVYWIFAFINIVQTIGWILSDETLYNPEHIATHPNTGFRRYFTISRIDKEKKFNLKVILSPFRHALNFRILLAAIAGALAFGYGNIVYIVETPSIFQQLFQLDSQQLALQYIPMIIGFVIGECLAGNPSDKFMLARTKKRGFRHPADRIAFVYPGYVLIIVGLLVWGIYLYKADIGHWNIRPLIGLGISSAGADLLGTILTAYCIDCHPTDATNVVLFVMCLRLIFGFVSPFYFTPMFSSLNYAGSVGLMSGILFLSAIWMLILHVTEMRKTPKVLLD